MPKKILILLFIIITIFVIFFGKNFYISTKNIYLKKTNAFNKKNDVKITGIDFASQISLSNELSDLGCEEAVVIMYKNFLKNERLAEAKREQELADLVEWQKINKGGHFQLNMEQIKELANNYYGFSGKIIEDVTVDKIKTEINNNHPVILPVTAKYLNNPFYNEPGYHVVLVIGYNKNDFIVHDPGTTQGVDYYYSHDTIMKAISELNTNKKNGLTLNMGS